jgi:hypothetical protein
MTSGVENCAQPVELGTWRRMATDSANGRVGNPIVACVVEQFVVQ